MFHSLCVLVLFEEQGNTLGGSDSHVMSVIGQSVGVSRSVSCCQETPLVLGHEKLLVRNKTIDVHESE